MADSPIPKSTIDPFATARRIPGVHVSLRIADVLDLRPDWTQRHAAAFLDRHGGAIAVSMLEAGTLAAARLLHRVDGLPPQIEGDGHDA